MADDTDQSEKTEEPTQKKLDQAHEKGDVAKSQEVNTWFVIAGATLAMAMFAQETAAGLAGALKGLFEHSHAISLDSGGAVLLWETLGLSIALVVGLPMLFMMISAVAGNLLQHKLVWSLEPITPKLSKVSPLAGLKRLFSKESLMNFAKGLFKIAIVSGVLFAILWPERDLLVSLISTDVIVILPVAQDLVVRMMVGVLAILTAVAGIDFLWQRHRWNEKQKMSMRELKEEFKQAEGDPIIRSKIRQIRMQRSRQRMMQSVPEATVVVTNPTHYSIALKYEAGMPAPLCVAKGVDAVALKIRETALEHDIPLVENPPLARALYATVEIEEEIPEEHYQAVAQVIGYVMRLKSASSWRSSHSGRT